MLECSCYIISLAAATAVMMAIPDILNLLAVTKPFDVAKLPDVFDSSAAIKRNNLLKVCVVHNVTSK